MIQPVSAFSPRAEFRGKSSKKSYTRKEPKTKSEIALMNATAASTATGCIVAAISRNHTSNWANALVLGFLSGILTMSFIAPSLIDKTNLFSSKKKPNETALANADKTALLPKNSLKPAKKMVLFRQSEKA